jgi:hypothetical protein
MRDRSYRREKTPAGRQERTGYRACRLPRQCGVEPAFNLRRGLGKRSQRLCLVVPERALIRPLLHVVPLESAIEIRPTMGEARRSFEVAVE